MQLTNAVNFTESSVLKKKENVKESTAGGPEIMDDWPLEGAKKGKKITNFFFLVVSTKVAGDILCIEFFFPFSI